MGWFKKLINSPIHTKNPLVVAHEKAPAVKWFEDAKKPVTPIPVEAPPPVPAYSGEDKTAEAIEGAQMEERKFSARGRSSTILTSGQGVDDEDLTISKRTLLGR